MISDIVFETKRLILRQWRNEDIPIMADINQDTIVMEHFPALKTYEETEKFVHTNMHLYKNNDLCLYAVEIKDTREFIGFVGLLQVDFNLPFTPAVEILWRIGNKYWGQGLAYEASTVICDYVFNKLGFKELVSFTSTANIRSINLMAHLGFMAEPEFDFDHPKITDGHRLKRHVFYRLKNKNL